MNHRDGLGTAFNLYKRAIREQARHIPCEREAIRQKYSALIQKALSCNHFVAGWSGESPKR